MAVCLRETVKGFMSSFISLKLSVEDKGNINCSIGEVIVYSNLCMFSKRVTFHTSFYIDMDTIFRACTERQLGNKSKRKVNFGEDKLIFKSNLSTNVLRYIGNKAIVDIPGKIFNIQLKANFNQNCLNSSLNLTYDWKYNSLPFFKRKHRSQFCTTWTDSLSGRKFPVFEYFFCYAHKFKILS